MDFLSDCYFTQRYCGRDRMTISPRRYDTDFSNQWGYRDSFSSHKNGEVVTRLTSLLDERERLKERSQQIRDLEREMMHHVMVYKEHYGLGGQLSTRYAELQYRIVQMKNENTDLQKRNGVQMDRCFCAQNESSREPYDYLQHKGPQADDSDEEVDHNMETRWAKIERRINRFDTTCKDKHDNSPTRKVHFKIGTNSRVHESELIPKWDRKYQDIDDDRMSFRSSNGLDKTTEKRLDYIRRIQDDVESDDDCSFNSRLLSFINDGSPEKDVRFEKSEEFIDSDSPKENDEESTKDDREQLEIHDKYTFRVISPLGNNDTSPGDTSVKYDRDDISIGPDNNQPDNDENSPPDDHSKTHNETHFTPIRTEDKHQTAADDGRQTRQFQMKKRIRTSMSLTSKAIGEQIIEGLKRNLNERVYQVSTGRPGSVLTRRRHPESSARDRYGDRQWMKSGEPSESSESKEEVFKKRLGEVDDSAYLHNELKRDRRLNSGGSKQRKFETYMYTREERDNILKNVKQCFIKEVPFCIYSSYQRRKVRR